MQDFAERPADISSLTPYVSGHNRVYDLSILDAAIGQKLAQQVATVMGRHLASIARDTAVTRWSAFRRFWEWQAASAQTKPFREATRLAGRITSSRDLETVTHLWFDDYVATANVELVTVAENVNHLGKCLDILAENGIFPKITRPRMPPNYHRSMKKRKSLAEVSSTGISHGTEEAIEFIRTRTSELDAVEGGEEYLKVLASSVDISSIHSAQDVVKAIKSLNAARLARVRQIAEDRLLHWQTVFQEGQELRSGCSREFEEFIDFYVKGHVNKAIRSKFNLGFFSEDYSDQMEMLKRSFVQYVHEHCNGVCPREVDFGGGPSLFRKLARTLGGREYFKGWFGAHEDAVAAAALIYLIDSGANISVVLGFSLSWEEPCDEPGHVKISGVKDRAGQKPIVDILPVRDHGVRISAVEALRIIRIMTEPYRRRNPELSNSLFVHAFFDPTRLSDTVLANRLAYFCRSDPQLSSVRLLPSYIRPSVLLQAALDCDGSILAARALGDHGRDGGVAEGYTMRYPTRLLYARMIRDFQELLQASIVYDIPGASISLGLSKQEAESLFEKAQRTGLGFSCKDPTAGVQPDTRPGETCARIENCLGCPMILFHATVENVADLILFRDHLTHHQPEWEATREERWNQVWLPYLAFAETVLEKLRRGPQAALLPAAEKNAALWKAQGHELLPLF